MMSFAAARKTSLHKAMDAFPANGQLVFIEDERQPTSKSFVLLRDPVL